MSGDDSARLAGWLEEMMARGTAKAVAPIAADSPAGEGGSDGLHANAKLMMQIKGLLLEMDELRDRLRLREGEIEQLRRDLAAAGQPIGTGPGSVPPAAVTTQLLAVYASRRTGSDRMHVGSCARRPASSRRGLPRR